MLTCPTGVAAGVVLLSKIDWVHGVCWCELRQRQLWPHHAAPYFLAQHARWSGWNVGAEKIIQVIAHAQGDVLLVGTASIRPANCAATPTDMLVTIIRLIKLLQTHFPCN